MDNTACNLCLSKSSEFIELSCFHVYCQSCFYKLCLFNKDNIVLTYKYISFITIHVAL